MVPRNPLARQYSPTSGRWSSGSTLSFTARPGTSFSSPSLSYQLCFLFNKLFFYLLWRCLWCRSYPYLTYLYILQLFFVFSPHSVVIWRCVSVNAYWDCVRWNYKHRKVQLGLNPPCNTICNHMIGSGLICQHDNGAKYISSAIIYPGKANLDSKTHCQPQYYLSSR